MENVIKKIRVANDGTLQFLDSTNKWNPISGSKVKVFTGYVTQTSANTPTVVVLEDTIGNLLWKYEAVGTYSITKQGAFLATKTVPNKAEAYTDADGNLMTLERTDDNRLTLKTYAAADTTVLADGVLTNQYIHFEIF